MNRTRGWGKWCKRCNKKFEATGKYVKICDDCKKPSGNKSELSSKVCKICKKKFTVSKGSTVFSCLSCRQWAGAVAKKVFNNWTFSYERELRELKQTINLLNERLLKLEMESEISDEDSENFEGGN